MPISQRTKRVQFYQYADRGTGGVVKSTWVLVDKAWASFRAVDAKENTTNGRAEHVVTGLLTIGVRGLTPGLVPLLVGGSLAAKLLVQVDGINYYVRGQIPRVSVEALTLKIETVVDDPAPNLVTS